MWPECYHYDGDTGNWINVLKVDFESEWAEGTVITAAKLDLATGKVFDIEQSEDGENYETLLAENIVVDDKTIPVVRQDDGSYLVTPEHLAALKSGE